MEFVVNHNATEDWTDHALGSAGILLKRVRRDESGRVIFSTFADAQAFALDVAREVKRYLVEECGDTMAQVIASLDSSNVGVPVYVESVERMPNGRPLTLDLDPHNDRLRFGDDNEWVAAVVKIGGSEVLVCEGFQTDDDDTHHPFLQLMALGGHLAGEEPGLYFIEEERDLPVAMGQNEPHAESCEFYRGTGDSCTCPPEVSR